MPCKFQLKSSFSKLVVSLLIFSMIVGCQTTKKEMGTVIGAVAGTAAGMLIGDGAGRALAVGIGAVVGGFLGNQIGKYLDEQDRLAVERESARALSVAQDGETVKWENPETKAEAEIIVKKTETIQRQVPIVRNKEVVRPEKLTLIGEPYEILKNSNVRFGPSMEHAVVKVLKKGSLVLAVGQVRGKNWVLINQEKRAIGYIHASLIAKEGTPSTQAVQKTAESVKIQSEEKETQTPTMQKAHDLDSLSDDMIATQTVRPAVDLDKLSDTYSDDQNNANLVVENIEVETVARTLTMKVSTPEGNEESTVVASKGTDGAWEII